MKKPPSDEKSEKRFASVDESFFTAMKRIFLVLVVLLVIAAPGFYILCLNHVSLNHCGIAYDSSDGNVTVQGPGWHRTSVFVRVASVSTLPLTVQIPSSARLINQRLVRFKPEGALDFVKEQGFEWYSDQDFHSIMLGFAYSGREFPFMEILEKNDGMGAATVAKR